MMSEVDDHRKMVEEMLATEDRGFTDRQIEILDSLFSQDYPYTDKQQTLIENIYKQKM